MLQKAKPAIDRPQGNSAQPRAAAEVYAWFSAFVWRQLPVIAITAGATIVLALIYVLNTPASYTAQATMLIDTNKVNVFKQQPVIGDLPVDSAMVESQVEILRSENIALAVIKQLHLTDDPEFVGSGGGLLGGLYDFVIHAFGVTSPASEFELQRRAAETFARRLNIKRIGLTYVIQIDFRAYRAERAAQIANAVADAYITDQLSAKYEATQRAGKWLQDRIVELREQATAADRAVVNFKAQNNIVDTGGRLMTEQQLSELNTQYILAQKHTAEMKARLDRIKQIVSDSSKGDPDQTVTDTLHNDVITKLREQYLELKIREADWSARYGSQHLAAVNLRNQMAQIRQSILDELSRIAQTYQSDYDIAKQGEAAMKKGLASAVTESQSTDQAQVALNDLKSSAQTNRTLYDNFLQRYMEAVQQESFPITEARVITSATPPLKASDPKTTLILSLSAILGLALGLGAARVRDLSDRVFRTSAQIEEVLETNCIAVMPLLGNAKATPASNKLAVTGHGRQIQRGEGDVFWEVLDSPFSRSAEAIRAIKVAADLYGTKKSCKVLGITSSLPNEGKSTIAAALAQLIAQSGAKVVLIDADLRNPSLSRQLAPKTQAGLVEVLTNTKSITDVVYTDPVTKLIFVPTALKDRIAHTSDILGSDATKSFIERLRSTCDYIIVDLSPLAPVVDVRTVTGIVDAFVFVVEWGRTKIGTVEHALGSSPGVLQNMLGVVLNKANTSMLSRYEGYHGYHYYNKYYSRYGYTD